MLQTCIPELLYFGDGASCTIENARKYAIVHACKDPCHRRAVGYSEKSLNKHHPNYLACEKDNQLFLNLVDPPIPLFQLESFKIFLNFTARVKEEGRPLLIHCNQGQSRAPSLAILCMAKCLGQFPNESYAAARSAFEERFPYNPGKGIEKFLTDHWDKLD